MLTPQMQSTNTKFRPILWDNINSIEDLKFVVRSMCGELAFNSDNPYYQDLLKKNLLGEEVDIKQEEPMIQRV